MLDGIPQGLLVKENATDCLEALTEMFNAIPKSKRFNYLGHLNDLSLFLERAQKELPGYVKTAERCGGSVLVTTA